MKTIPALLVILTFATVCSDSVRAQILNYPRVDGSNIPGVTRQIIMRPMPTAYPLPGVVVAGNPQLQRSVAPAPAPLPAAPVVYAVRPVNPEKAQADREEADRKAVIFQRQRASEDFA